MFAPKSLDLAVVNSVVNGLLLLSVSFPEKNCLPFSTMTACGEADEAGDEGIGEYCGDVSKPLRSPATLMLCELMGFSVVSLGFCREWK